LEALFALSKLLQQRHALEKENFVYFLRPFMQATACFSPRILFLALDAAAQIIKRP
jgi:hypothetical protein